MADFCVSDFRDVCEYFTAVFRYVGKTKETLSQKNSPGKNIFDTWIGDLCGNHWFRLQLSAVKVIQEPMRKYVTTTKRRDEAAKRIAEDSEGVLQEMRDSGGWRQLHFGHCLGLALGSVFSPNNGYHEELKQRMGGDPTSS